MPDGPPWIAKVEQIPWNLENTYHVELDENQRWTIQFSVTRPAGAEPEISVNLRKPKSHFGVDGERFMVFNDHYSGPGSPGEVHHAHYKFDNEDIYISAQWLDRRAGWTNCTPSGYRVSGENSSELSCEFTSPQGNIVTVRLARE